VQHYRRAPPVIQPAQLEEEEKEEDLFAK